MNKVLVLIQLIGGNDGLNTVVPMEVYDTYRNRRPSLGIALADLYQIPGTNISMPRYAMGLAERYEQGELAIIQNVGYQNQDFSHFRSTDIWMSSYNAGIENTGWVGRHLESKYPTLPTEYPAALKIGRTSSLLFQAGRNMGISITSPEKFYQLVEDIEYPLPNTIWAKEAAYIRDVINQSEAYSTQISNAYYRSSAGIYGNSDLEAQLAIVARLIAGGLQTPVYHVTLDGFDTHSNQKDAHQNLITTLSSAIDKFSADLVRKGVADRVLGMTFSEFGRRVFENESRGTDHGAASVQFMFGKPVKGGLYGSIPNLMLDNLGLEYDFRRIYADAVKWLEGNVETALLGSYDPMGLVNEGVVTPPPPDKEVAAILYTDGTWESKLK